MTTMSTATSDLVYVWTWLPGTTEPIPAGVLAPREGALRFGYGRGYLARPNAIALGRDLPLSPGWVDPLELMPSSLRDAAPDAWGMRVILARVTGGRRNDLDMLDQSRYLLESGSNRPGAVDFQASASAYAAREDTAPLDQLHRGAQAVDDGRIVPHSLDAALLAGTSIGGARPKALLRDDAGEWIAKFSSRAVTGARLRTPAP